MARGTVSRRSFIRSSAAAAAGLSVVGGARTGRASPAGVAWTDRMAINPDIDNRRVVSMKDPAMVKQDCPMLDFQSMTVQNSESVVDKAVIQANLDTIAMALAVRSTPGEAWATIFRKPASKAWSEVRVVIKTNALGENHPRVAVIDKVCQVLHSFGVPFANMTLYDAGRNCINLYSSLVGRTDSLGLPAGITVQGRGNNVDGTVTIPTVNTGTSITCTQIIASSGPTYNYDIMVNVAVNKGHTNPSNGLVTLTMKNHLGSVNVNHCPNMNMMYLMNTSDAIVGGDPPRQQLCIVDSLWGQLSGPSGTPGDWLGQGEDPNVYRLIMGTFGPAIDYLTVKKVREPEIHATHNTTVDQYVTSFGYTTPQQTELLTLAPLPTVAGPGWVDMSPAGVGSGGAERGSTGATLLVHAAGPGGLSASVALKVPSARRAMRLSIHTLRGELVRDLGTPAGNAVLWDGRSSSGTMVSAGTYVARLAGDGAAVQKALRLVQ